MMTSTSDASLARPSEAIPTAKIGRRTAWMLIVAFLTLILIPPFHQTWVEFTGSGHWRFLSLFDEVPTSASLKQFEEGLSRESELAARARLFYQTLLTSSLRHGNDKIFIGRDGFLFYEQEIELAAGPGFLSKRNALARDKRLAGAGRSGSGLISAIVDFHSQLRGLGIHLVFVPLPLKPFIYPERVWAGYPDSAGPAWNGDRETLKNQLVQQGVDVVDLTDVFWRARSTAGGDLYLKLDTHWAPRGLAIAADELADHLRPYIKSPSHSTFTTRRQRVTNFGDLLRLLEVLPDRGIFEPQTIEISQVLEGDQIASGDDSSPILLLGDSFTNIYRRQEMEWGIGAGLGEQLMLRLGVGVQVIAINGGGATAVRESLAQKPHALRSGRVVVWACSARDLGDPDVDWSFVSLPKPE